jgi:hypothetical protein
VSTGLVLHLTLPANFLDEPGARAGFVLLCSFLLSFLFIRTSARMIRKQVSWWPGNVSTRGGLHLHHLVFGVVLLLVCGFLGFALAPKSPWEEILAAAFGIGAGLTLDEFALWVHLEDVYWTQEGRASLDAVVVAALLGGLVVLGLAPFDLPKQTSSVFSLAVVVLVALIFSTLAILKGKPILGLVGLFVPLFSMIGTVRLATPTSPWARRRYHADGARMIRSRARFERVQRRRLRLRNAVAGAPNLPVPESSSKQQQTP